MRKRIDVTITLEQDKILQQKSRNAGFNHKGEYVRFLLFVDLYFGDKIQKMLEAINVKNK